MNLFAKYQQGLTYAAFLERYANPVQHERWQQFHANLQLSANHRSILTAFRREMPVLCLAGAWCGDCVNQCPIFERFAELTPTIKLRFLDRDDHADVQQVLQVNGGNRVPVVVFFSEDGFEVARFGERTLSKYRQLVRDQLGASCPTGIGGHEDPLVNQVVNDWLNEFERVQWLLCQSPRLRQKHRD
ncbi:MAG: thioredoxin family protein [Gemmataceae bacterium]